MQTFRDGEVPLVIREQTPEIMDVTAQAEVARRVLSEPLRLYIASAVEGDPGPWVYDIQVVAKMLAVSRVEDSGKVEVRVGLDPAMQSILRVSLAGQPDAESEVNITHPDGRILPLLTHTSALHDANGQVRGAIAVFNDHSRLKALEEDKRRADRLAAMGALATGIAHEIRNPLVAIKTFAELLPDRADDQEFRSTFAKVASKEVRRIEELLGRLRALAVPAVATLHPLELAAPIADTLDLLRGEADRRRILMLTEIEPELPPVLGEADQLKQLFLNLFLNAFEAMATGGTLSVTVRADRPRRGSRAGKPAGGFVTVRVTDTGAGIPRDDLPRIFEPFFTTKTRGTGLGLAICRGIADAHRARLWAEVGPAGVGTAFVVQLPALVGAPVAEVLR